MSELLRYYVSTKGSDGFSGLVEKPNTVGTDGPLKTVQAAIQKLTALRREGKFTKGAVEILVEPGIYSSPEPLVLGLESLGNPDLTIEIRKNGEGTDFRQCAGEVRTVCQKLGGEDHGGEQPEVSADGVFPDKIYAGAPAGKRPRQAERRPCGW